MNAADIEDRVQELNKRSQMEEAAKGGFWEEFDVSGRGSLVGLAPPCDDVWPVQGLSPQSKDSCSVPATGSEHAHPTCIHPTIASKTGPLSKLSVQQLAKRRLHGEERKVGARVAEELNGVDFVAFNMSPIGQYLILGEGVFPLGPLISAKHIIQQHSYMMDS